MNYIPILKFVNYKDCAGVDTLSGWMIVETLKGFLIGIWVLGTSL